MIALYHLLDKVRLVDLLIKRGINVNALDRNGSTALDLAIKYGNIHKNVLNLIAKL